MNDHVQMQLIRIATLLISGAAMVFILWVSVNHGRRRKKSDTKHMKGNGTAHA